MLWLVILVCSLPFALKAGDALEYDMTNMSGADTESNDGQQIIDDHFVKMSMDEIIVISYSSDAEFAALYDETNPEGNMSTFFGNFHSQMAQKYPTELNVTYGGYYKDNAEGQSGIILIAIANVDEDYDLTHETGHVRDVVSSSLAAMNQTGGTSYNFKAYVTGSDAISYDTEKSSMEDVSKVDPLSILLIFVLLALFFYALVTAFVPPATVGMAYGITLVLMYAIGQVIGIYYITQTLLLVVMLGAGCDYSIFIMTRYRDERKKGMDHDHALKEAVMWGGESVATSGISVMIGFAALTLCSFSMVQTMGIILALGILVALIAALTFIPSLLNIFGDKMFWPSNIEKYKAADEAAVSKEGKKGVHGHLVSFGKRYFGWLSRFTHKYAIPIVVVFIILCIPTTYYYATTEDSSDMISVMPDSESVDGINLIMTETDGGTIMPTYLTIELNDGVLKTQTDGSGVGSIQLSADNTMYYIQFNEDMQISATPAVSVSSAVYQLSYASDSLSNVITQRYGTTDGSVMKIVGSVSGPNAWNVIYLQAYQTVVQGAIAEGMTAEQAAAYATPSVVNHAIYTSLKAQSPTGAQVVETVFNSLSQIFSTMGMSDDAWNLAYSSKPFESIPALGATDVTVANLIDYYLNVYTGILSKDGKYVSMTIITSEKPMSDNTMDFINDLRDDIKAGSSVLGAANTALYSNTWVSGSSASMNDIGDVVEEQFSFIRVVVIILLILLLFFILGCYVTPIRAVITIVMSVIWTVALTRIVFDSILDTPVLFLIPIVLFVVLLGLGMDYEIFLTTKIRENKIKGMDNDTAIDEAVKNSGGVISLCALLMGGTFLTLLLAGSSMLQEFGFALGVGILIDGLFMVGFVSPSLMHLLGDWSWKGPKFLQNRHHGAPAADAAATSEEKKE